MPHNIIEALLPLAMHIDQLHLDPSNARKHNPKNLDAIKSSLAKFGQRKPVVVQREGMIVRAGNGTLQAAKALGWDQIAAVIVTEDNSSAAQFAIADNRTAELAEWDTETLATLLHGWDEETRHALGFEQADIDEMMAGLTPTEIVEDDIPEPPVDPITKPGDLWLLGDHRLLCGDSTKAEDVARLMNGERAQLMNTDPPYGVSYANDDRPNPGVAKPRVANDSLTDEQLQSFLEACFRVAVEHALLPDAAWYMWHAHLTQGYFAAAAAAAANVVLHRQIIWVKPVLLLGRGQYHWKHEPCFMGWVKGNQPPDYGEGNGERTQTTVWEVGTVTQAERKEFNHATPKPVRLFEIPLVKHTKKGEIAYEPFSGSGPQIIAAEQLGRKCYGMEISPQYCDVIVKRWETLTGKKAEREHG